MLMEAYKLLSCGSKTTMDLTSPSPLLSFTRSNMISSENTKGRVAVLICLFEGVDGDLRVILTKRSSSMSFLSQDEVVLPGRKMEEGDRHEVATALRAAKDELGLDPLLVDVVAVLETLFIKGGPAVVPVVGLIYGMDSFHPTPTAVKVESIIDVPLDMFLKNDKRREVEMDWKGEKGIVSNFDHEANGRKYAIFGFTAGVLIEAATVVYKQSPPFVDRMHWRFIVGSSKL